MKLAQLVALMSQLNPGGGGMMGGQARAAGGMNMPDGRGFPAPIMQPRFNPSAPLFPNQIQDRRGQYMPVHMDPNAVGALIDFITNGPQTQNMPMPRSGGGPIRRQQAPYVPGPLNFTPY